LPVCAAPSGFVPDYYGAARARRLLLERRHRLPQSIILCKKINLYRASLFTLFLLFWQVYVFQGKIMADFGVFRFGVNVSLPGL